MHLLQFQWNGKVYQFQCLPFGLTPAYPTSFLEGDETGSEDSGHPPDYIPG